jgi:outer membrane protein assembly factor BamB
VVALWAVNAMACAPVTRVGPAREDPGWRVYLGSPRHDASAGESLAADPQPVWHATPGRAIRGAMALGDSVIAVGTTDRAVVLLQRSTGKLIWRHRVPGTVAGGPLLAGDRIFVGTQAVPDGRVVAIRLRDGKTIWETRTGGITAPLALGDSTVIAASDAGRVVALDAASGRERWRRSLGRAVRTTPILTADGIVIATLGDSAFLLDAGTGAIRARTATPGTVIGTPASSVRRLYAGTTAGHLLALSVPDLRVVWDRPVQDAVYGAPALVRDTVFAVTAAGTLWRVPTDNPDGARSLSLGVPARAGPTPIAGAVLVGGITGEVLRVATATDAIEWRIHRRAAIEAPPLVRDGELFLVLGDGTIEAWR